VFDHAETERPKREREHDDPYEAAAALVREHLDLSPLSLPSVDPVEGAAADRDDEPTGVELGGADR
jgi:hypothetical protein